MSLASYKESSIYQVDVDSLAQGSWLTGQIIHLGFLLLEQEFALPHVKLIDPSLVSFLLFEEDEQDLMPLQKLSLFKYRYIYLPVNTNNEKHEKGDHWALCIYDTLKSQFYLLNSMSNYPSNVQKLKQRLQRLRLLFNKQQTNINIELVNNVPKQNNSFDCGVFVLFYTYSTLKSIKVSENNTLNFHDVLYCSDYFKQIRIKLKNKIQQCKQVS